MPLDWTTGALMRPAGCVPCCAGSPTPPADCACALLIPPLDDPYADYATAEAVISDPFSVTDCLFFQGASTSDVSSADASFDGTTLYYEAAFSTPVSLWDVWASVTVSDGATLTFDYTGLEAQQVRIYNCAGERILNHIGSSGIVSPSLDAGTYSIRITALGDPVSSLSFSVTSSDIFVANPVIALWDDSGTTRQLEACPKMLLPPLTESSGDWYADCAEAESAIAGNPLSDCEAFNDQTSVAYDSESFSGTEYTFSNGFTEGGVSAKYIWWSVNLVAGDTVTIACTVNATTSEPEEAFLTAEVWLYDYTGTELMSDAQDANPGLTVTATNSMTVPYTGRYIFKMGGSAAPLGVSLDSVAGSGGVASSGSLSVNPIQALYDVGLDCPARLDCGDACP